MLVQEAAENVDLFEINGVNLVDREVADLSASLASELGLTGHGGSGGHRITRGI